MTLDDLMDDIDEKLVGHMSEKDALTPDEYNILLCWNFDDFIRHQDFYEYANDERVDVLNDTIIALEACGAQEWSQLLFAYLTFDRGPYQEVRAGTRATFEPKLDYKDGFYLSPRARGLRFDTYMRSTLETFASARRLIW